MSAQLPDSSEWRLSTANGIPYKLIEGPTGSFNYNGEAKFKEVYIIEENRLLDFIEESFPPSFLSGDSINFTTPRLMPGSRAVYTTDVTYDPLEDGLPMDPFNNDPEERDGGSAPNGTYARYLKLNISYEAGKPADESDPTTYLQVNGRGSAEFLNIQSSGSTWEGGDPLQQINLPINQVVAETEWTVTFPSMTPPAVAWLFNRARPFLGQVNGSIFGLINNAPVESVLFTGIGFSESFSSEFNENKEGQVEMSFLEKRIHGAYGHNHFYRPDTGQFERIILPDGSYVYNHVNLNAIIG